MVLSGAPRRLPERVDAAIVGGGPAGLAAGIVLAQHGVKTLLCERRTFPVDKVCGEGIMPSGVAHLKELGVERYLDPGSFRPFSGIRYFTKGNTATGRFAEGPGWGMRRLVLSEALYRRALQEPGLTLLEQVQVSRVEKAAGGWIVHLGTGAALSARLIVGADGLHSKVRQWAGLAAPSAARRRWGVRRHFRVEPWSEYVEVYWSDGVEAYITPCAPDLVEAAFLWDEDRHSAREGIADLFERFLALFPALHRAIGRGEPIDAIQGAGPLRQTVRSPVTDGVLLIGDAAGYLDAITGEGVSLALSQAMAIGDTVVPALKDAGGVLSTRQLLPYARACRRIARPYCLVTRSVLAIARYSGLTDRIVRSLSRQPDAFQTLLSLNMGYVPGLGRLSGALSKLVWGLRP